MKGLLFALFAPLCAFWIGVAGLYLGTGLWKRTTLGRRLIGRWRTRSPLKDNLLRPPGQQLRGEIELLTQDLLFYALVVIYLPVVAAVIYGSAIKVNQSWIHFLILPLVCVVLCLFPFQRLRAISKERRDRQLGLDGEMATGEELNQLMLHGYHVFHDFPEGNKFNVDHVVVGPTGVFAVETKTRVKPADKRKNGHKVFVRGSSLEFPRFVDEDFIKEAKDRAHSLSDFLSGSVGRFVPVNAILALPGWLVERVSPNNGVAVINPKEARKLLLSKSAILDEQTIRQVCFQIEQRCRSVEPYAPP